jgi:hypothetical protein
MHAGMHCMHSATGIETMQANSGHRQQHLQGLEVLTILALWFYKAHNHLHCILVLRVWLVPCDWL